ncbi:outer membrane beta-barrel protein [Flavobacterium sp. UMI-01]|uniref:outer membrane beta-barrel protein n=1 Tax=Flavobacterium sp. UMI-01 TaxID=1441053 RepID=UPI001C7D5A73|nr:outer membrane beta-barrel protein [Flavobacterium sp. UMI-01]GIZ09045.1 hypothetical protein FUMI01_17720 [Flavobacterium sp. UMI-01]
MNEHIDKKIVQKIKEQLYSHEEKYQEGAWENFLAKKKKKKRRTLYWFYKGAAAIFILMTVIFSFLKNITKTINDTNINIQYFFKDSTSVICKDLEQTNKTAISEKSKFVIKDSIYIKTGQNNIKNIVTLNTTGPNYRDSVTQKKAANEDDSNMKNSVVTNNLSNKNDKTIDLKAVGQIKHNIKYCLKEPESLVKIQSMSKANNDNLAIDLLALIKDSEKKEVINKTHNNIRVSVLVSPSFGSDSDNIESVTSSNYGAGFEIDLPLNHSHFSLSTGTIYNTMNITNESNIVNLFSNSDDESKRNESKLNHLDIPLNITYNVLNDKIYLRAGLSSYIIFSETIAYTSTTYREVEVFQSNGGVIESFITKESVTTKKSINNDNIRFSPLKSLNLSFGFRAHMSKNIGYEIQPFYKYPISALTKESYKVHSAGVTVKVFFSK